MRRLPFIGLGTALILLVGACGEGVAPGPIRLTWKLGSGVACSDPVANIDTIRIKVLMAEEEEAMPAQSFSCSEGGAVIEDVPPGTYALQIEGGSGANFTDVVFSAAVAEVIVLQGGITDLDVVEMEKVQPEEVPGGLKVSWSFETGLCGANGVRTVELKVWRDGVYRAHTQVYACDLASGFVLLPDLPPGDYVVVAEGMNTEGQIVRRAVDREVTIEQGSTTELDLRLDPA